VPGPARDIHVVTNGQLRSSEPPPFEDPDSLVELSAAKRSALLANPFLGADDEPARLLATEGSRIAGRIDLVAGELETPEGRIGCFWGSALHVAPAFRGKGIAAELLREAEAFRPAAGACAPSRMSLPLYRRLGYLDLALRRHVLIRNVTPLVRPRLGRGRAAAAVAEAGNLAARAQRGVMIGPRARRSRVTAERRDSLPRELEPEALPPYATCRPPAWVDWVVHESFHEEGHERALYLVAGESGDVLGYFVVKTRRYSGVTRWRVENLLLGSLVDWRIFEPSSLGLDDVVLLALDSVGAVDAFEVCVPPGERARLGRLGFVRAGAQHLVVKRGDGGELADDPMSWSIRPGDGDHVFS
jgi:GNAT superfamily N-acetyltransferase